MKQETKTKFERNSWYEKILRECQRGRMCLTDLSKPTQLAIDAYLKQRDLHERLENEKPKAA
jgi:hypothetical protein